MAGNIKGITIEFKGETTQLDEAIRKINKEISSTDSELKKVNNALKFNPTSVELWKQKQELLKNKISETKEKLDVLKAAQKKMDTEGVDKNSAEYRNLQREIITTESKLKSFETQLRKIGNVSLKALSEQLKKIGDKMVSVGKTMTTKVTTPIVAGYTLASKYASDYEENLNKLDVAFGSNADEVKKWSESARTAYGLSKVQATDAASAFGALGKGIGLSEDKAAEMSMTLAGLSADLGSYFNVGIDQSSKALEGIFTGESEALKKFGVVMTETNLQKFAEDQGLVYKELSQTEKTLLRYNYVLSKTKDAQGDFARTSDGTANSIKIFKASLQDLGTAIGTNLLPIITPIIQKVTELLNKFNELSPRAQKIITIIGLVVAALGPALVLVGSLITAVGTIIGVLGMVTAPMLAIAAVIAVVIAAGVALYKNWDKVKAKAVEIKNKVIKSFNELKTKVKATWDNMKSTASSTWSKIKSSITTAITNAISSVKSSIKSFKTNLSNKWAEIKDGAKKAWDSIKEKMTSPIESAKSTIEGIVNKIKGWFPISIGRLFTGLTLPHFSLNWSSADFGKLGTIKYPTGIGVSWYAKGGIFDSPSLIGVGEAGPEAVVPLDKLWDKLDNMKGETNIVININGANASPKEIAEEVKRSLVRETNRQRLAWQ